MAKLEVTREIERLVALVGAQQWKIRAALEAVALKSAELQRERDARLAESPELWKKLADKDTGIGNLTVAGRAVAAAIRQPEGEEKA